MDILAAMFQCMGMWERDCTAHLICEPIYVPTDFNGQPAYQLGGDLCTSR